MSSPTETARQGMPTQKPLGLAAPKDRGSSKFWECVAIAGLVGSALFNLSMSWRRWPDPVIDAGHQLYTAWRLSEGALLYRDVGCLYGPLSSYVNASLFRLFGPGMMTLVWFNLAVYATILILTYRLFRVVYGALGAVTACAVLVWIFSFNQLIPVGNYTYALPYAHESTHGVLVTLVLVFVAARWVRQARTTQALYLGFVCGLTLILKPEFILASGLVVMTAVGMRRLRKLPWQWRDLLAWSLGALTPMAIFVGWFWRQAPFAVAFRWANQAWWTVLVEGVHAQVWKGFSGTDAPKHHLLALLATSAALWVGVGLLWTGVRLMARGTVAGALLIAMPCALALLRVNWMQSAWCVPLTLLLVIAARIASAIVPNRCSWSGRDEMGLLLALVAFALLVRMFLNPRLYHFGFYQAALACMVVVAELAGLLRRAAGKSRMAAAVTLGCTGLVLCGACLDLHLSAREIYSLRTLPVGEGRDQFLAFSPKQDAEGLMVQNVVEELRRLPRQSRVLVLPEGLMVNYLARRKSPLNEWIFIDLTLANGAETRLVNRLAVDPPEHIVLLSRDMREHGITRFGASGQPGHKMLIYIQDHYRILRRFGGDPFDVSTRGAILLALTRP